MKEDHMPVIVDFIDQIISDIDNEELIIRIKEQVNAMMSEFPMFAG